MLDLMLALGQSCRQRLCASDSGLGGISDQPIVLWISKPSLILPQTTDLPRRHATRPKDALIVCNHEILVSLDIIGSRVSNRRSNVQAKIGSVACLNSIQRLNVSTSGCELKSLRSGSVCIRRTKAQNLPS